MAEAPPPALSAEGEGAGGGVYAFGIARNHPFSDGNKRTAWVMARLFLRKNAVDLALTERDAIAAVFALAGGELSEEALADWSRERLA